MVGARPAHAQRGRFQIDSAKAMQDVERGFGRVVADARAVAKAAARAAAERPARAAAGAVALFAALVGRARAAGKLTLGTIGQEMATTGREDQVAKAAQELTHVIEDAGRAVDRAVHPHHPPRPPHEQHDAPKPHKPPARVRPPKRGADHAAAETAPGTESTHAETTHARRRAPRMRHDARIPPPPRRFARGWTRGSRRRCRRRRHRRRRRRLPILLRRRHRRDDDDFRFFFVEDTVGDDDFRFVVVEDTVGGGATSILLRRRHRRRATTSDSSSSPPTFEAREVTPEVTSSANANADARDDATLLFPRDVSASLHHGTMLSNVFDVSRVVIAPGIFAPRIFSRRGFFPLRPFLLAARLASISSKITLSSFAAK